MPQNILTEKQVKEKQKLIDDLYALGMSKNRFGFFSDYFQVEYDRTIKQLVFLDEKFSKKSN